MHGVTRQTRSGRSYSQWTIVPCSDDFDYGKLLSESFALEPTVPDEFLPAALPEIVHPAISHAPSAPQSSRSQLRKEKRQALKVKHGILPSSPYKKKHVNSAARIPIVLDCETLPAAAGGYVAKPSKIADADREYTKQELIEQGFTYVSWNGRDPMVGVDAEGRICMVFVGRPNDSTYDHDCQTFSRAIDKMGERAKLGKKKVEPHARGCFPALNVGVIHGKGTTRPVNLSNGAFAPLLNDLLARRDCQRVASFASKSLAAFAPQLFAYYDAHLKCLYDQMPDLRRIFPAHISVFPSAAVNVGPNVWTYKHRDILNCPFGMCAVQALGEFDPTKGGQMVLWEPRLIVEFPPGALILIPSATITHSNLPVAPGDHRSSFTQYASGGLFRFVDYGFQLEKELKLRDPMLFDIVKKERDEKWKIGLDLLEKVGM